MQEQCVSYSVGVSLNPFLPHMAMMLVVAVLERPERSVIVMDTLHVVLAAPPVVSMLALLSPTIIPGCSPVYVWEGWPGHCNTQRYLQGRDRDIEVCRSSNVGKVSVNVRRKLLIRGHQNPAGLRAIRIATGTVDSCDGHRNVVTPNSGDCVGP